MVKLTMLTISLFSKWLNNSNSRRIYRHPLNQVEPNRAEPNIHNSNHRTHNMVSVRLGYEKTVISIHVTSHNINKSHNTQSLSQVTQKKTHTFL